MVDLLTYALDPAAYDCQPFLAYADSELTDLVDLTGKTVIDVGAGTGRLAFAAAPLAKVVFAVEPVANLRDYMRAKALGRGLSNLYPVDGLITAIPFPAGFAHVTLGGHVFGDDPEEEYAELLRVTQPGGTIVLLPGNNDGDNQAHAFLSAQGFQWARFIEPPNDAVRKYWKVVE
jgi:SAM-dependent methyltransferase